MLLQAGKVDQIPRFARSRFLRKHVRSLSTISALSLRNPAGMRDLIAQHAAAG